MPLIPKFISMKKLIILIFFFLAIATAGCKKENSTSTGGLYSFYDESGKWGYIDKEGTVILEPQWDLAYDFYLGYGIVSKNSLWGLIDRNGNEIIPLIYQNIGNINVDLTSLFNPKFLLRAKLNDLWGYIDQTGAVKIPFIYEGANQFSDGLAAVKVGVKYGFIDEKGELKIPAIYDGWGWFRENLAWVGILTDGVFKWGVINKAGETVVPFNYDNVRGPDNKFFLYQFVNGISAYFIRDVEGGFMNATGETLFGTFGHGYWWTNNFSEGLAPVSKDNLVGYINVSGDEVITRQYGDAWTFWNGSAPFKYPSGTLYGYLKTNGDVLIQPQYLAAYNFNEENVAWVLFPDNTDALVNTSGETVWRSQPVVGKSTKNTLSRMLTETGMNY